MLQPCQAHLVSFDTRQKCTALAKDAFYPRPQQLKEDRIVLRSETAILCESVGIFDTSLDMCRGTTTVESSHNLSSVSALPCSRLFFQSVRDSSRLGRIRFSGTAFALSMDRGEVRNVAGNGHQQLNDFKAA